MFDAGRPGGYPEASFDKIKDRHSVGPGEEGKHSIGQGRRAGSVWATVGEQVL